MTRCTRRLLLCAMIGALGACEPTTPTDEPSLSASEFVDVLVEIRQAEREVAEMDSALEHFERRKGIILERHSTSEEELREFAAYHARDLAGMDTLWDAINERLRYTLPTDTASFADSMGVPRDLSPAPAGRRVQPESRPRTLEGRPDTAG